MILDNSVALNLQSPEELQALFIQEYKVTLPLSAFVKLKKKPNLIFWMFSKGKTYQFRKTNGIWKDQKHLGEPKKTDAHIIACIEDKLSRTAWAYVDESLQKGNLV